MPRVKRQHLDADPQNTDGTLTKRRRGDGGLTPRTPERQPTSAYIDLRPRHLHRDAMATGVQGQAVGVSTATASRPTPGFEHFGRI